MASSSIICLVMLIAMVALLLIQSRQIRELTNRMKVQKDVTCELMGKMLNPDEINTLLDKVQKSYKEG